MTLAPVKVGLRPGLRLGSRPGSVVAGRERPWRPEPGSSGAPAARASGAGSTWSLTGRAEELRFIEHATRGYPHAGSGAVGVVLAGAAGVGKTRLAREAIMRVEQRGGGARWVTATASAQAMPLGAFAGLVDLPGSDASGPAPEITAEFLAAGSGPGAVIGIDDAHLLDDHSAMVVHRIATAAAARLVVTVRTGETAPDAVTALWKDGPLQRLDVQPLSETETVTLLEKVLDGPLESAAARRIWRMTQGNALYLRQLVDAEVEADRLRREAGIWRWTGDVALSPALTELVASRMGTLPAELRDVLDLVSLCEPLELDLLGGLVDPVAVERAEDGGLVQVEPGRRGLQVRLGHPLFGEVRRAGMGRVRGRRLRSCLASALAAGSGEREDVVRRAQLTLDSDLAPDADLLTTAAESAVRAVDLPLAERLARSAVRAGAGFRAQAMVAFAASHLGDQDDVIVELARMCDLAATDAESARATVTRVSHLAWVAARPEEAESVLEAASRRVADPDAGTRLKAMRALLDAQRGRSVPAVRNGTRALAVAGSDDDTVVLATCGVVAGLALLGRCDEIGPVAERGVAAAASSDLALFTAAIRASHSLGLRAAGRLSEANLVAEACRQGHGDEALMAEIGTYLAGETALARGHMESAIRQLSESRAGLETYGDSGGWRYACLIALTRARAMSGDLDATRRALTDLEQHRHPMMEFLESECLLARAWVAAAEGGVSDAIALAREAATLAGSRDQFAVEVVALQTAVQFGDPTCADSLAELAGFVDGPRAPAVAAYARALAEDDGDALQAVSCELEAMGDLVAAADAAAHAAAAHRHRGRTGSAHAAAARAHRLSDRCEGVRTPALREAAEPLPLTSREREIATLAARGLTNQQIADRLVVSVRTVEGHLYRAGQKLGTTRRTELADVVLGD